MKMPIKHLTYGGSTIARTIACPGWASLAKQMPRQEGRASDAAEEGTALHDAMEWIMGRFDRNPTFCKGLFFNSVEITAEMIDERLWPAYAAIRELMYTYDVPDKDIKLEPFVQIIPDLAGGSIDVLARSRDGKTIIVADYKFGYMPVDVAFNKQLLFYALCADADPLTSNWFAKAENIVLAIIQPAVPGGEDEDDGEDDDYQAATWATDISMLDTFEDIVAKAVAEAEGDSPKFEAGDHCRFCPAEVICPIKTGEAQLAAKLPAIAIETIDTYMPMLASIEKWIAAVREMALSQLQKGAAVEGFKLVNKRPTRVWTNSTEVQDMLRKNRKFKVADIYAQTLKSPAQMEKVLKAKKIDDTMITDYIVSVSSGVTMAPAGDKREAVLPRDALRAALQRLPE
jgi:hypothetical protein